MDAAGCVHVFDHRLEMLGDRAVVDVDDSLFPEVVEVQVRVPDRDRVVGDAPPQLERGIARRRVGLGVVSVVGACVVATCGLVVGVVGVCGLVVLCVWGRGDCCRLGAVGRAVFGTRPGRGDEAECGEERYQPRDASGGHELLM